MSRDYLGRQPIVCSVILLFKKEQVIGEFHWLHVCRHRQKFVSSFLSAKTGVRNYMGFYGTYVWENWHKSFKRQQNGSKFSKLETDYCPGITNNQSFIGSYFLNCVMRGTFQFYFWSRCFLEKWWHELQSRSILAYKQIVCNSEE